MDTKQLLKTLADARNLHSDYAIAKYLNITRQRISGYQNGYRTLGDELAIRIAEDLKLNVGYVLSSMAAERATHAEIKKAWEKVAKKMATVAAGVLIVFAGAPLFDAWQATDAAAASASSVYYVKSIIALWLAIELLSIVWAFDDDAVRNPRQTHPATVPNIPPPNNKNQGEIEHGHI